MTLASPPDANLGMAPGSRQLFVYWRLREADLAVALQAAQRLHEQLRQRHPGLHCSLFQRADTGADGLLTLMETYASATVIEGIDAALQAAIAAAAEAALGAFRCGARHLEVFDTR